MFEKMNTDPIMIEIQGDLKEGGKKNEREPNKRLELRVDVPCMRRLRKYEDPIDIRKLIDPTDKEYGGLYGKMMADPSIAVDIAYEATRGDPNAPDTPEAFADGLFGDALGELTNAVLEAVVRFTPVRENRQLFEKIVQVTKAEGKKEVEKAIDKLNSIGSTPKASTAGSSRSAGSSNSTPTAPTPSES